MENPWKRLKTRSVYRNPWIHLREDQVLTPAGKPGIYGVVEAKIATAVIAFNRNREIYLVGQYRYPTNMYSWEIVAGGAELSEDPQEAAKRELKEEGGLVAARWGALGGEIHLSNCYTNERGFLYWATDLTEVESEPDETEVLQVKKVTIEEAHSMVQSGEIVCLIGC